MAFPVSEEQKAIFRRRLAATAREVQPPTGSFAESARARQAAANDRANGIMPVRGPDQPAFSYQDHVGNNNRQLYGNSQANRGGNENAQGYVPHPSPRIPAAPVPSNGYDEPGVTLPNAMPVSEKPVLPGNINQLPPGGLAMPVRQQPAMASRLPPLTPQGVAAISRSQAEGRGADSLREKIAGIMAAPGPIPRDASSDGLRLQQGDVNRPAASRRAIAASVDLPTSGTAQQPYARERTRWTKPRYVWGKRGSDGRASSRRKPSAIHPKPRDGRQYSECSFCCRSSKRPTDRGQQRNIRGSHGIRCSVAHWR